MKRPEAPADRLVRVRVQIKRVIQMQNTVEKSIDQAHQQWAMLNLQLANLMEEMEQLATSLTTEEKAAVPTITPENLAELRTRIPHPYLADSPSERCEGCENELGDVRVQIQPDEHQRFEDALPAHHAQIAVLKARLLAAERERDEVRKALLLASVSFGSMAERMIDEGEGPYESYASHCIAERNEARRVLLNGSATNSIKAKVA
jgi:hypothetical protein